MSSSNAAPPGTSVVVPVYNEADSLVELHREIRQAGAAIGQEVEIIFVDDGSTDASWDRIVQLQRQDPDVSALRFRRNFGKAAALAAGFSLARGEQIGRAHV